MQRLNTPWLPFILFGPFCVLAAYSMGRYAKPHYHLSWRDSNAEKLASVYNLTPREVAQPVNLWEYK